MDGHLQAKIFSKIKRLDLPDYQLSLPLATRREELNELVIGLLSGNAEWSNPNIAFDFLIGGVLLQVGLQDFIDEHGLSTEDVLQIECILREKSPVPKPSLLLDDWVSDVKITKNYLISACYDNTVSVWTTRNQKQLVKLSGHNGPVKCLTLVGSEADKELKFASGSHDQTVVLWAFNVERNEARSLFTGRGHERTVECLCSNADGSRLASGSFDTYVKIWNTSDKENQTIQQTSLKKLKVNDEGSSSTVQSPMVTLAGHREVVSGIDWSPNDEAEIVTCSWDREMIFWDLESAAQKSSFLSPVALTKLAFSPLNRLIVTGSTDPYVRLWDPRLKVSTAAKSIYSSHSGWVVDVCWSKIKEHLFASASYDRLVKIWDTRSFKAPLYDLAGHDDKCLCCDWSNSDLLASGAADCTVKLYTLS